MNPGLSALSALLLLLATLAPTGKSPAEVLAEHESHPGLSHPEPGDGDHHHGDADDHHETPDSPCHHHEDHTCCNAGPALALPNVTPVLDAPALGFLSFSALEPRLQPSARELFHVPLA